VSPSRHASSSSRNRSSRPAVEAAPQQATATARAAVAIRGRDARNAPSHPASRHPAASHHTSAAREHRIDARAMAEPQPPANATASTTLGRHGNGSERRWRWSTRQLARIHRRQPASLHNLSHHIGAIAASLAIRRSSHAPANTLQTSAEPPRGKNRPFGRCGELSAGVSCLRRRGALRIHVHRVSRPFT